MIYLGCFNFAWTGTYITQWHFGFHRDWTIRLLGFAVFDLVSFIEMVQITCFYYQRDKWLMKEAEYGQRDR